MTKEQALEILKHPDAVKEYGSAVLAQAIRVLSSSIFNVPQGE